MRETGSAVAFLGTLQRVLTRSSLRAGRGMQAFHQSAQQLRRVDPELVRLVEVGQRCRRVAGQNQLKEAPNPPAIGESEHVAHLVGGNRAGAVGDRLVEDRQAVAG